MRKHLSICDSTIRVTEKRFYKKGSKAWVQAGPHVTRHNVSRGQRYREADRGGVWDKHKIHSGQPGLGEPQESSSPIPPFIDKERSEMCGNCHKPHNWWGSEPYPSLLPLQPHCVPRPVPQLPHSGAHPPSSWGFIPKGRRRQLCYGHKTLASDCEPA